MLTKLLDRLGGRRALYAIVALFSLQSLWIAISSRFPMAFDEYAHVGITQLHTKTIWPFLHQVPPSAAVFGPVQHDPSFLYYYLLSFPLRIIEALTTSQAAQIISLRIINIAVAVGALLLFAKLFNRLGLSGLQRNIVIFFVSMIPAMSLMAGQVTYDNLFFVMVALTSLMAVRFAQSVQAAKTMDVSSLNWLLVSGLYACFVKYAFLPAMLALVIFVVVVLARRRQTTVQAYRNWWHSASKTSRYSLVACLLLGAILFAGSYGVNVVKFHTPLPSCSKVLGDDACVDYGPWYRDHLAEQSHTGTTPNEIIPYIHQWFRQMMFETFFLVGGRFDNNGVVFYRTYDALPIMLYTAWLFFAAAVVVLIIRAKWLWARLDFRILILMFMFYMLALFGRNLQFFIHTGVPTAIHGRYALPLIIPVIATLVLAGRDLIGVRLKTSVKAALLVVGMLIFIEGGVVTFINGSTDDWIWPQFSPLITVNHEVRNVIHPILLQPK